MSSRLAVTSWKSSCLRLLDAPLHPMYPTAGRIDTLPLIFTVLSFPSLFGFRSAKLSDRTHRWSVNCQDLKATSALSSGFSKPLALWTMSLLLLLSLLLGWGLYAHGQRLLDAFINCSPSCFRTESLTEPGATIQLVSSSPGPG